MAFCFELAPEILITRVYREHRLALAQPRSPERLGHKRTPASPRGLIQFHALGRANAEESFVVAKRLLSLTSPQIPPLRHICFEHRSFYQRIQ